MSGGRAGMRDVVAGVVALLLPLLAGACAGRPDGGAATNGHGAGPGADDGSPPAGTAAGDGSADATALQRRATSLFERALVDNRAIAQLADLLAAAPKRLSGSTGADDAVAFAVQRLRELGCTNVRAEPVLVPRWERGVETAAMTTGSGDVPLRVTALGGSVPTPPGGIEAEVVRVRSFAQLQELGEAAAGRIVFFDRAMPRALRRTFQAYGDAAPQRTNGAIEAARVGAAAVLVRSLTTAIDGFPHTGAMQYETGLPMLPAAAIATADAERLAAACVAGPVRVRLELGCTLHDDVESANVVGELAGSELPDEIVVIGAHLDAWDLGTGAHDDGAGCAHVFEALRLLQQCGLRPRRTIRAVLFMNEENGLRGAAAYAAAHASDRHAAAIETDAGGFTPLGFTTTLRDGQAEAVRALLRPLEEFGCGLLLAGGGGGADIRPLGDSGVPLFGMLVESSRYFDYHHSARDTIDQVNERELALGAAALAYVASVLADR